MNDRKINLRFFFNVKKTKKLSERYFLERASDS